MTLNFGRLVSASACALGVVALSSALPALSQSQQTQPQQTQPQQSAPTAPARTPTTSLSAVDRQFMIKAAQSDLTEIQTSQLALQRASNPQVREYAQMMINEHTQSSNKLKQLARQKGVTLPTTPGPDGQALLARLRPLSGAQFDRPYMLGQANAHAKTETEYRKQLRQGQDQNVRAFASQVLPIVAEHRRMAQNMVAAR